MSSSGPMSLAIAYEKPIIVSSELKETLGLGELTFKRQPDELAGKIEEIIDSTSLKEKALDCAKGVQMRRYWGTVSKDHENVYQVASGVLSD